MQLKYSNYVAFSHDHGFVVNNSGLLYPQKIFSVYNRMHAPQTFYCHEQKAYEHQILFPMSEGPITLVEFSPSDKPSLAYDSLGII